MKTLVLPKSQLTSTNLHYLFSSAGTSSGLRTLSYSRSTPLPPPHAEAEPFPSLSPLNGRYRQFHLHPYDLISLACFSSQLHASNQTFRTNQETDHPRNCYLNGQHVYQAGKTVILKHDQDENNNVGSSWEYLQITQLRWLFIRKVYGIVASQLLVTAAVCSAVVLNPSLSQFLLNNPMLYRGLFTGSILLILSMLVYKNVYPKNFILLGAFTLMESLQLSTCCALLDGTIVLQALATTTVAVISLTGYTFWAANRGKNFSFLEPILLSSSIAILTIGLINMFIYPVPRIDSIAFGACCAWLFSAFLVLDTDKLIKHHRPEDYITASVDLYMDVIDLFVSFLYILLEMKD